MKTADEKAARRLEQLRTASEKTIEWRLRQEAEKRGGVCLKLNSMSGDGWPDRLVLMPGGRVALVELKSTGEALRPLQAARLMKLQQLGFTAVCIDSLTQVREFMAYFAGDEV